VAMSTLQYPPPISTYGLSSKCPHELMFLFRAFLS
jgi:hypothetical protein